MKKLRKGKSRARTQRSIEMEKKNNEIIERERQKLLKKKENNNRMLVMLLCLYSLAMAILSWLFDFLGIIAAIAIVCGIFGLKMHGTEKKDREFYCAIAGLVLAIARELAFIYTIIASTNAGL